MVYGIALAVLCASGFLLFKIRQKQQRRFIKRYRFHPALKKKLKQRYPHLNDHQVGLVFDGLRDYFLFCHQAGRKMVAMPSQVVDVAWHEFILFTRAYASFSRRAIGRFLHHTPTEAMRSQTLAQEGIKRAWRLACANEQINPAAPSHLPLLFALDGKLAIQDGFVYAPDCRDKTSPVYANGYCAGHIGCASGCAGDSAGGSDSGGFFDGWGSNCGTDCGGGCGGD